jgi:phosphoglycerate dehydrogenase-like enzyme
MPKVVLDLNDRRPAWAIPPWVSRELREALPSHWTLEILETEADGSGDGSGRVASELLEAVRGAEIYLGYGVPPALLAVASELRWVHSAAAGVGSFLTPELRRSPVLLTNSKGIHAPPMAETALAMMLFFGRGLDFAVASQAGATWDTGPFYAAHHPLVELSDSTVGIFGFGGIGREVARRVRALGGRVLACDRSPGAFRDAGRMAMGPPMDLSDPELETLHGEEGFRRLLEESDFLVLAAPETPGTRGILNRAALARMRPSAVLLNLSRGGLVETESLLEALEEGRLRGAGLDVFHEEPLPSDHPLWRLPNVLITPHVSAVSRGFWRRQTDLILENLGRYLAGRPLLNLVDKQAGF